MHLQKEVLETVYSTLQEENSLCLADVCEVFRCDVIGRVIVPDYWDVALCLEDDMKSLHRRCSVSRMAASWGGGGNCLPSRCLQCSYAVCRMCSAV